VACVKKKQIRVDPRKTAALLASTRDSEKVKEILLTEYGLKEKDVPAALQEGRDALAIAADVDARMEFATRREQLEDLRVRAKDAGDLKTELEVMKEQSKLCDLYRASTVSDEQSAAESSTTALAREHLEALPFVERGLPFEELARLVANRWIVDDNEDADERRLHQQKQGTVATRKPRKKPCGA
ncbi:MAG: hypothetical protein Q4P84_09295, partial [Elusimicrobiales bacterium]|nr:hypothetical protein [Elusimicrobiales bacterium]